MYHMTNEYRLFLTSITVCSDKTVLTSFSTHSTDMVTRFFVFTVSATTFFAIKPKIPQCALYIQNKAIVSHKCYKNQLNNQEISYQAYFSIQPPYQINNKKQNHKKKIKKQRAKHTKNKKTKPKQRGQWATLLT